MRKTVSTPKELNPWLKEHMNDYNKSCAGDYEKGLGGHRAGSE